MHRRPSGKPHIHLLSRLLAIQKRQGHLSEKSLRKLSKNTGISLTHISEVASFYSHLSLKPRGKHVIRVCDSPSCYLRGSENILKVFQKKLGIKPGQTTQDGLFTLELSSCIGLCDKAPAALLDGVPQTNLTKKKIEKIIEECR
ncbi:MAG: NADH-quinone oxidoreductase subunit NuoE [Candidatus Altiarchaeales archaeon]|nr:NADH-quinone oxidoreductase subunit NuoE [Candidatus Altiarchaeales archaeon]